MAELLSRPVLPTAVFAEYDELAIGALWALRRSGLAVPGDVSVIGVDDHEMAAMLDLTTVGQSVPEQGEVAAQLLLGLLDGMHADGATNDDAPVMLPTRLVLRGTTAPPAVRRVVEHSPRRRGRRRPAR
jgi:DNA-binding LacI/PurR family transcriptional regulator